MYYFSADKSLYLLLVSFNNKENIKKILIIGSEE